ncbi:hypothetical protein GCM10010960_05250 [Arenimonas maotaiensis]|uniref:Uncharacterized protein n=1 Tax=Arenimonas maotaiensis TaxID=1446479 RepID=A0A917FHZ7_9GAMM|nr:hypothetical protein [Arenimonas maotaiensis]GGF86185.1 hypothetical protein GCM10010960_05250 [Arenimonas maotaiensis]
MTDKIKQYGLYHFIRRSALSLIRRIFEYEKYVVFEMPDFRGSSACLNDVISIDSFQMNRLIDCGGVGAQDIDKFQSMLSNGEIGIGVVKNGILVGSAWVQKTGIYRFAKGFEVAIPENVVIMKNLFVSPLHRGSGLGKILNAARLTLVPAGFTPVVFIVYDNRIAIRNWMAYGFKPAINVCTYKLFGSHQRISVRRLSNTAAAVRLERSMNGAVAP